MKPTRELASHFAKTALGHVTREWPNKMDHVLTGPEDIKGPRELHPIFYGSFDWHSCVHSHWLLAKLLRLFPDLPEGGEIRALLDDQFTPAKVAGEVAYLARPSARGFERPYGWAWLLKLQSELVRHDAPWAAAMKPLADAFVQRFRDYLPLAIYPTRAGVHSNTAFALILARDYAKAAGNADFAALLADKARDWYGDDRNVTVREPSQSDFLSPTLVVAACMKGVMSGNEFAQWLGDYLASLPDALLTPATVTDRSDGQIAHLDGLNLSRAWCWRLVADALDGPARAQVDKAVAALLKSALDHVAGDYMGEHWLASFALLALDP